jgi:alkylation response protein AidB-like acyl-CoA dehydrogenase
MREAPFLLIGEGTSEIQKTIISRAMLREYRSKLRTSASLLRT